MANRLTRRAPRQPDVSKEDKQGAVGGHRDNYFRQQQKARKSAAPYPNLLATLQPRQIHQTSLTTEEKMITKDNDLTELGERVFDIGID